MTDWNLIAAGAIIVLAAIILIIKVVKGKKEIISIDDFIDTYGDKIIAVLQDAISVLKINMSDFESKDEYETAVIASTINILKENSIEFGISESVVNLLDTDSLTSIIKKILNENKFDIFSVLDTPTLQKNKSLLDEEVVNVLSEATVSEEENANGTADPEE